MDVWNMWMALLIYMGRVPVTEEVTHFRSLVLLHNHYLLTLLHSPLSQPRMQNLMYRSHSPTICASLHTTHTQLQKDKCPKN